MLTQELKCAQNAVFVRMARFSATPLVSREIESKMKFVERKFGASVAWI